MADKKELQKDGVRRFFTPIAADIAIKQMGWHEVIPMRKPVELINRINKPPEITGPKELITAEPVKTEPVKDEVSINKLSDTTAEPVKAKRKSPVRSKAKK